MEKISLKKMNFNDLIDLFYDVLFEPKRKAYQISMEDAKSIREQISRIIGKDKYLIVKQNNDFFIYDTRKHDYVNKLPSSFIIKENHIIDLRYDTDRYRILDNILYYNK